MQNGLEFFGLSHGKKGTVRKHTKTLIFTFQLAGSGEWTDLSTIVTYNATYQFYWGQMAGLIKALPTSAETFSKKQRLEFKWGMPHKYERHRIMKISDRLLPGTSSNVSVWAFKTRR